MKSSLHACSPICRQPDLNVMETKALKCATDSVVDWQEYKLVSNGTMLQLNCDVQVKGDERGACSHALHSSFTPSVNIIHTPSVPLYVRFCTYGI